MKERVTLTLDQDLIKKVDSVVDGSRIKNRSHAVELMLIKSLGQDRPKKALILAGGKGKRLQPLTSKIPKPLVKLNGKPIIEYTIDLLKKYNIKDILISVGYMKEKIKNYFGDGSKFGIKITYIEEEFPLGTAGPLALAKPYLTETFVMCNADELKDIDLVDMYLFHRNSHGLGTIALTTVTDPSSYGVALLNGNKIVTFVEKPAKEKAPSNLINSGLYILEPEVIKYVPEGFAMVENDVFPKLARDEKLYGYPFSGQWFPTDTPERIKTAEKEWKGLI